MGSLASNAFGVLDRLIPTRVSQSLTASYFRYNAWRQNGSRGFHSAIPEPMDHGTGIKIQILPALSDNYMYLIADKVSKEAAVVDPVHPQSVLDKVSELNLDLKWVLTTHHHWDHAGGNAKMKELRPDIDILGGDDRIDGLTRKVSHGDTMNIGSLKVKCLFTPCHTTGHICYFVTREDDGDPVVFTGDTLFLGGCGRFFEGDATQMHRALMVELGSLPEETKVFCGHEYSLQNLKYGRHVEPDNEVIRKKIEWCREQREKSPPLPTVPSTIGEEKSINPFMRVDEPSVRNHTKTTESIETMRALRAEKDHF